MSDWIPLYGSVFTHPKTRRLAKRLGVSVITAGGHMASLWLWAMEFAKDGDLSRFDGEEIEIGAGWDGPEGEFLTAAMTAGYVERADERLLLHDWAEYGGKLAAKRSAERERSADRRKANDGHEYDQRSTSGRPAYGQRSTAGREEERREEKNREEQDLSSTAEAADTIVEPDEIDCEELEEDCEALEVAVVSHLPAPDDGFDEFWSAYPRKEGSRKRAAVTWRRLTREKRRLALGIAQTMGAMKAKGIGPERQYIPLPTTFLNGEHWDGWRDGVPANWAPEREEVDEIEAAARRYAERHGLEYA